MLTFSPMLEDEEEERQYVPRALAEKKDNRPPPSTPQVPTVRNRTVSGKDRSYRGLLQQKQAKKLRAMERARQREAYEDANRHNSHPMHSSSPPARGGGGGEGGGGGGGGGPGGAPPPPTAPTGWWAAVDNKTGRMYYYNRRTNETSWTVPLGLTKEQIKMNSKSYGGGATKVGTRSSV